MDQDRFDIPNEGNRFLADARIDGNVKSEESVCLDGYIGGNVSCAKCVIINKGSIVDGDVNCNELYINGWIKGNVCVAGKTVMRANAVIDGGLITACLEITPGAKIGKGLKLKNTSK